MGCNYTKQCEECLEPENFCLYKHHEETYQIQKEMKTHIKICQNQQCKKLIELFAEDKSRQNMSKLPQLIQIGHKGQKFTTCQKGKLLNQLYMQKYKEFRAKDDYSQNPQIKYSISKNIEQQEITKKPLFFN